MSEVEKKEIEETLLNSFNKDDMELSFNGEVVNDHKMLKVLDDIVRQALVPYFAEAFYNAGYGKVEDYKKELEKIKDENLQLSNSLIEASTYLKSLTKDLLVISKSNKEIEQQAIKKFAQQLLENQSCHNVMCQTVCYISEDDVKIALKEFGIGE